MNGERALMRQVADFMASAMTGIGLLRYLPGSEAEEEESSGPGWQITLFGLVVLAMGLVLVFLWAKKKILG